MENLEKIKSEMLESFTNVNNANDLNELKIKYLGKKGIITELNSSMKDIPNEKKKEYGMAINELRILFNKKYDSLNEEITLKVLNEKLSKEKIDITRPATNINIGSPHMLERLIEEIEEFMMSMGYDVVEGPEVEEDYYNFELLNLPKGHPARDAQDTFYITDEMLLRSQTSPVQARTMLANTPNPIRIICPGKTYRRDNDDATHSHQFTQIEGLVVDKKISLADLKYTFDQMAKKIYGDKVLTRFRPSFYPFTEPSVEMDISCFNCGGDGCPICKTTGWITVGGAGVVHPHVLEMCGYDPEEFTGFAFGMGAERWAMLKYGITDIRTFYTNDIRALKNFDRREDK